MARLGQTYLSRHSKFSNVWELENLSEKCMGVTWLNIDNLLPLAIGYSWKKRPISSHFIENRVSVRNVILRSTSASVIPLDYKLFSVLREGTTINILWGQTNCYCKAYLSFGYWSNYFIYMQGIFTGLVAELSFVSSLSPRQLIRLHKYHKYETTCLTSIVAHFFHQP